NSLLGGFGYAVAETTHDCGELGGLAQSRKRFLLVARHVEKVPPFLYEPEKKSLRAVGDILGRMPLPGDIEAAGPMHRVPSLQWKTWVRLALVRAGSDWRSLNDLAVEDGYLRDLIIVPEYHRGVLGVNHWGDSCGVVAGAS
ncbi:DNA cytosine methyltransferase, partial [Pseudomonas paraeruginosa]